MGHFFWDTLYIHPEVDRNGTWRAEEFGWMGGSDRANFTSNQSEHLNALIRYKIKFEKLRMDDAVFMFVDLQLTSLRELARCYMGTGETMFHHSFVHMRDEGKGEALMEQFQLQNVRSVQDIATVLNEGRPYYTGVAAPVHGPELETVEDLSLIHI